MLSRYLVSQVKHNSCFLVGLALGLWVSLSVIPLDEEPAAVACSAALSADAALDDFQPQRDERPLGAAAPPAGRSVQRPRYYSTELGMRGSVLTAVLSSEEALRSHIAALNRTAARLQPALKFFITAREAGAPGLANVVGFTDTREMLKPFHALKYLADNYLEEYDFFFLVSDAAYVNARRLAELAAGLSVSRDVYMGAPADGGPHCSLDAGMLLSNSVLRGVQASLEWCVRNSYSPHHHENIGRCVLRAHRRPCASAAQGRRYAAAEFDAEGGALLPHLASAVTVHPVRGARALFALHAFVARERLQRARRERMRTRAQLWRTSARHPPGFRNATWPGGLRADPGLAPPLPATRFDHLRWVAFNASHAFFPDDRREVAPVAGAMREALDLVVGEVRAWALRRWPEAGEAELVEGAWRWEPATALRYRLLLRLRPREPAPRLHQLRLVEAVRALGAARLAPVRYVTESARVTLVLPLRVRGPDLAAARAFLRLYETVCLDQDKNTALLVVLVAWDEAPAAAEAAEAFRGAAEALREARPEASLRVLDAARPSPQRVDVAALPEADALALGARAALAALEGVAARDALLLLMVPHAQFNQEFLNRVRMNTISGEQWFAASAFGRFALYDHPRFVTPQGAKPTTNTGRFNVDRHLVFSVYRGDYEAALAQWRGGSGSSPAEVLGGASLRCLLAPEPALVLEPRPPPCAQETPADVSGDRDAACLARLARDEFSSLALGARHSLAQLLLEAQADAQP